MKRLIAAGILAALLCLTVGAGSVFTEKRCDLAAEKLSLCRELYFSGQKKSAADIAAELSDYWEEGEAAAVLFSNRGRNDEICISLSRLTSFALAQDDALFSSELRLAETLVRHMRNDELFNIF